MSPPNASRTSELMAEEPTTPDVIALLRSGFEALNRRDFDAMPRIFASDAVYDVSSQGLGIYEGLAAIRALFEEWWSAYDELESELKEVVNLGNGVFFVALLQKGRPVGSTAVVQLLQGWVMVVVDGMVVRVTPDAPHEARAAAERLAHERADG
jgi:ketosteroid isomerase-like protein